MSEAADGATAGPVPGGVVAGDGAAVGRRDRRTGGGSTGAPITGRTAAGPAVGPLPAGAGPARVHRFGGTERAFHWIHAAGFSVMAGTGVIMYLPALSTRIADRPTLKAIHLTAAVLWVTALVVVSQLGDRRALRQAVLDLETFDDDDRHWLRGPARRRGRPRGWRSRVPQGRFNAAEKSHAIVQAALAVLFVVSGVLLWLGERDTTFQLPGTIPLHDAATYLALALVAGHLYLSLIHPPTRPALSGMVRGDVDAAWAREHHRKWDAVPVGGGAAMRVGEGAAGVAMPVGDGADGAVMPTSPQGPGLGRIAVAAATAVAGVLVVVLVVL